VQLKSGGPNMTVSHLNSEGGHRAHCFWFDGNTRRDAEFNSCTLNKVTPKVTPKKEPLPHGGYLEYSGVIINVTPTHRNFAVSVQVDGFGDFVAYTAVGQHAPPVGAVAKIRIYENPSLNRILEWSTCHHSSV
jgi:uncharacterized protein YodC (DUF2158 family)